MIKSKVIENAVAALVASALCLATSTAMAADYYWTGNDANDNVWSTVGNWGTPSDASTAGAFEFTKADGTKIYLVEATEKPGTGDNAYFESTATVTLTTGENIKHTYFNADVTFTSTSNQYLNLTQDTSGTGKITLEGKVYLRAASKSIEISNPLEIASEVSIKPNSDYIVTLTGKLTGSGTLICNQVNKDSYGSVRFQGDTKDFSGTVRITMEYKTNNASNIGAAAAADNSNSRWEIYPNPDYVPTSDDKGFFPFRIDGGTFKFGYLYSNVPALATAADCKNITLEIGAKDEGSYLGGGFASSTGATVKWIGVNSIFTNACAGIETLLVSAGGKIYIPSTAGIPTSLTFTNGGTALAGNKTVYDQLSALTSGQSNVKIVYGGDVAISSADGIESISVEDNTIINFTHDDTIAVDKQLFTIASGNTDKVTINILSPNTKETSRFFKASVDNDGKVCVSYVDGIYYWTSATAYNKNQTTETGWTLVGDQETAELGNRGCVIVFPYDSNASADAITIAKGKEPVGAIYFGKDVQFEPASGNDTKRVLLQGLSSPATDTLAEGPGKIILKDGVKLMQASTDAKVYCDIVLEGSTKTVWSAQDSKDLYLFGSLTGSAEMEFDNNGQQKGGNIYFYGSCANYTGTMKTAFTEEKSVRFFAGENGEYSFGGSLVLGETGNTSGLCGSAGTYTFGSLSGKVKGPTNLDDITIITGAAQTEDKSIAFTAASSNPSTINIKNTGAHAITVTGNNFSSYTMSGTGAFKLSSTLAQSATLTKKGTAANAKYPALLIEEEDVDLTGLNLALEVPAEVSGWQYLVQATSFSGNDATGLSTYTKPDGRNKYNLKMKSDSILGASDATGFSIILSGSTGTEINDGNLETWLTDKGYAISDSDIGTKVMEQKNGIAPLEAYLLGYDSAEPTPSLAAEVLDENISFNFAGTTPREVNGLELSYEIQSRDSATATWVANAYSIATEVGAKLAFANAGLYNQLVATIAEKVE